MTEKATYGTVLRVGHDIDVLIAYAEKRNHYDLRDRLVRLRTLSPADVNEDTVAELRKLRHEIKALLLDMQIRMNGCIWDSISKMGVRV